jgi:acid stress-induced BolA-like protein IbaG/YrbA
MQVEEIKHLIAMGIPDCQVSVSGDGRHFEAIVVSAAFAGKPMLAQHRMVYATLGDRVEGGAIHALSIRSYTPEEWRRAGGADLG